MKLKLSDVVNMNQVIEFYHHALKVDEANEKSVTMFRPANHYFFENKDTVCFYWISIKKAKSILLLVKLNMAQNTLELQFEEKLESKTIPQIYNYLRSKQHKYIKINGSDTWKDPIIPHIKNLHEAIALII